MDEKKKCPKGKIMRKKYIRKKYTTVTGAKVRKTTVKESCIKDRGKPGKGPKTLPPIDDKPDLKQYGYSLSISSENRRKALRKAAREEGILPILRRVNLIRNYTKSVPHNYAKLSKDVDYLKELYAEKKRLHPSSIRNKSKKPKSVLKKKRRRKSSRVRRAKRKVRFSTKISKKYY